MKRFLVKHVGNMGDMIFLVPPILETLKKHNPDCHITLVTAWGFKEVKKNLFTGKRRDVWGKRNQSGFCIALMMTNPHVDELVHYHDTHTSLVGAICHEDGKYFNTWSKNYYEQQKKTGGYDAVYELDIGLAKDKNPIEKMYKIIGLPGETYSDYKIYLTDRDKEIALEVMKKYPYPRIVLLEGLEGETTRGWNPAFIPVLERMIEKKYGVSPIWFGGKYIHEYQGRLLTLRENIATLSYCDVGIGVLSGPLHFAGAVGLPTLTLFADQPLNRAALAYFLNPYIKDLKKYHRTLLGPSNNEYEFLKNDTPSKNLTPQERATQGAIDWEHPGRQSTKSPLAVITPEEVMGVLSEIM